MTQVQFNITNFLFSIAEFSKYCLCKAVGAGTCTACQNMNTRFHFRIDVCNPNPMTLKFRTYKQGGLKIKNMHFEICLSFPHICNKHSIMMHFSSSLYSTKQKKSETEEDSMVVSENSSRKKGEKVNITKFNHPLLFLTGEGCFSVH